MATKQMYNIAVYQRNGYRPVPVLGNIIEIDGCKFILHRPHDVGAGSSSYWVVSEYRTGAMVAAGDTQRKVVDKATSELHNRCVGAMQDFIERHAGKNPTINQA